MGTVGGYNNLGPRVALAGGFEVKGASGFHAGNGFPLSGPAGTLVNTARSRGAKTGSVYLDKNTGVMFVNEGTAASPYWTPTTMDHPGIRGWSTDFRSGLGKALADTAGTAILGSGVKVHGQGIDETDSGLVVTYTAELGPIARLTTTDEVSHLAALGIGNTSLPFQPDTHGPIVVDGEFTNVSAITLRTLFMGVIGASADALDPVVSGSTLTLTLVLDDLAGMFMGVGLTNGSGIFAPHNKSDEAASILTTATGVDCGSTVPAAGTYSRWRVEISAAGVMKCFVNKVQVTSIAAALDVDEELNASLYVSSTSTAGKSIDLKRFGAWGKRA